MSVKLSKLMLNSAGPFLLDAVNRPSLTMWILPYLLMDTDEILLPQGWVRGADTQTYDLLIGIQFKHFCSPMLFNFRLRFYSLQVPIFKPTLEVGWRGNTIALQGKSWWQPVIAPSKTCSHDNHANWIGGILTWISSQTIHLLGIEILVYTNKECCVSHFYGPLSTVPKWEFW